jgi:lipoyl(octanoyl) transferase
MSSPAPRLLVVRLGTMRYADALALQRAAARARIAGALDQDELLLVEHPPVVTLGRSTKATSLPLTPEAIRARGVEVHEVERGGDVTFHGPGQLVGYPIVDLKRHRKDLHWHLRQVEQGLIDALGAVGLPAGRRAPHTGVWVGEARKIASSGVHARDWVTWHGFALNVSTALSFFDLIVPCGIHGVDMTSVARELGREVSMEEMERAAADGIASAFSLAPVAVAPDDLVTQLDEPSLALR